MAYEPSEIFLGGSETWPQWVATLVGGYIVGRFLIYLFNLDTRLRRWANIVREYLGLP